MQVAETAMRLAEKNNCDKEKAYLAGLFHDVAREISQTETIRFLKENNFVFCDEDFLVPEVLHGHLSAIIVSNELNIQDKDVLQAMKRHTTGEKDMTTLDAVIFLSDMIEPARDYPGVQELRALAEKDLFKATLKGVEHTITYLLVGEKFIHPRTIEVYNWMLTKQKEIR